MGVVDRIIVVDVAPGVVAAVIGFVNVGSGEDAVVVSDPREVGGAVTPLDGTLEDGSVDVPEPDVTGEPGAVTPGGMAGLGVNIVPGAVDGDIDPIDDENMLAADVLKLELPRLDNVDVVVLGVIWVP